MDTIKFEQSAVIKNLDNYFYTSDLDLVSILGI